MMKSQSQIKIGITYDLKSEYLSQGASLESVAEFEDPETIEALTNTLIQFGFQVDLITNIHSLVKQLSQGERWDLIFNIAEGLNGSARESQIPCLLEAYQIPYVFSDAATLCVCMNKAICKKVLRDSEVKTADFFVVHSLADLEHHRLPFPLFAKPVAEGSGKGIHENSIIHNAHELREQCEFLLNTFKQPVLVETYLPGDEYTVGILGTGDGAQVLGVMKIEFNEDLAAPFYSLTNKQNYENRVTYRLADPEMETYVGNEALKAWRHLGCRDGGRLDMRLDQHGVAHFIEVNPLAGLHPEKSDLVILARLKNMTYHELISMILRSALLRIFPNSAGPDGHLHGSQALTWHPSQSVPLETRKAYTSHSLSN